MDRKLIVGVGLLIAVGAIIINDQHTYSNDFMTATGNGVGRLDDESIERALASTMSTVANPANEQEIESVGGGDLGSLSSLESKDEARKDDAEEEVIRPSDLEPETLYLFEAYIPIKKKTKNGKEVEKIKYLNSDPQFSSGDETIQGTLEYQYDYFDDQGVARTVLRMEANYSQKSISLGPIFIKDRSNVYYLDDQGSPVNGQLLENTSRGERTIEFLTGEFHQYRFTFCIDLMKCSEQRSSELSKREQEEIEHMDAQSEENGFEVVVPKEDEFQEVDSHSEKEFEDLSQDNFKENEGSEVDVEKEQIKEDAEDMREQNTVNTEGSFDNFMSEKVEASQGSQEMEMTEEQKVELEENKENESDLIKEEETTTQTSYIKQPADAPPVVFTETQVANDSVYRFTF